MGIEETVHQVAALPLGHACNNVSTGALNFILVILEAAPILVAVAVVMASQEHILPFLHLSFEAEIQLTDFSFRGDVFVDQRLIIVQPTIEGGN